MIFVPLLFIVIIHYSFGVLEDTTISAIELYEKLEAEEKKEKEEAIEKGIDVSALIIDKKVIEHSATSAPLAFFPVYINNNMFTVTTSGYPNGGSYRTHSLKIYAKEKNYDIQVPESIYQAKGIGDKLDIKLYKDKIVLAQPNEQT
ncbi:hypothetical protein QTG56_25165 (plasmid) [Rossellomorea sp. AcN35-11]|nr:hypothetical protein [Rossellomorea aquimaris]WJV31925.1 hypothetical protein QTG56_25165 [Rossellomorea sp. AcN35-11]